MILTTPSYIYLGGELQLGSVYLAAVVTIDETHTTVNFSLLPQVLSDSHLSNSTVLPLNALRPGMLINSRVTAKCDSGFQVTFLDIFKGYVDRFHMSGSKPIGGVNSKCRVRILYILGNNNNNNSNDKNTIGKKSIGCSVLPTILQLNANTIGKGLDIGSIVDATVKRVDSQIGVEFELPNNMKGYGHVSYNFIYYLEFSLLGYLFFKSYLLLTYVISLTLFSFFWVGKKNCLGFKTF